MDYRALLKKYMLFLLYREGSCFVDEDGPEELYGEAKHMSKDEKQELARISDEVFDEDTL
jgi:hypothetical protein